MKKTIDLIKVFLAALIAYGLAAAQTQTWNGSATTAWYENNSSAAQFAITTAEDLAGLAQLVNDGVNFSGKTIKLEANITLNETEDGWSSLTDDSQGFIQWTPIGKYSPQLPFSGTFDGNGYVVKGVYISNASNQQGLFGFLGSGGTVKNLGVTASYVKGNNMVGGLVGRNSGAVVNCYIANGIAVDGNDDVGGLVGGNYSGTINNCYAVAITQNKNYYGALGGYNSSGTVTNGYWDKTVHNSTFGIGVSKTTAEMQTQRFVDDFNLPAGILQFNKWQFIAGGNYPSLLSNQIADDPTSTAFQNGSGTEQDPYIIQTVAELKTLSEFTNAGVNFQGKFFKLAANIAVNDTTNWNNWSASVAPANFWTPIGTFKGTLDGNGYVVRGVYIYATNSQGLFLTLDAEGTIKNLGVIASYINGGENTGGLVGTNKGKIINCYLTNTKVTAGGSQNVGGLAGSQTSTGSINNCYSAAIVTGGGTYGGGLVGGSSVSGVINNSYHDKDVSTKTDSNKGAPKTTSEMKTQQFADDLNYAAGGLQANKWQFSAGNYPTLLNDQIAEDPATLAFESGNGEESTPFLIITDTQLRSFRNFVNGGRNFDGQFIKLGSNINLNDVTNWEQWDESTQGLSVWTPIGTTEALAFKGTFDGDGYVVNGVYISSSSNYQGLFGWLSGTLKNIGVAKSYIKGASYNGGIVGRAITGAAIYDSYFDGKVTGTSSVGGLVGWVFGRNSAGTSPSIVIRGSRSAGTITVTGSTGSNNYAGGLVGHNQNSVLIDNCYSTATVTGYMEVGGLAGSNYNGYSVITNSRFSGTVTGTNTVGGLVGINYGEITNSYSNVAVSGTDFVGGIAGKSNSAKINNCYSTGTVSGATFVGGLSGQFGGTNGEIQSSYSISALSGTLASDVGGLVGGKLSAFNNCTVNGGYYNEEITNRNDSELGEGKTAAQMKSADIITELNEIATVLSLRLWELSGENGGYPVLSQESGSIDITSYFDGGIGTGSNPYQIRTPQQMENLSTLVDAGYDFDGRYFKLTANIELNDTDGWENWTAANGPSKVWKPVGYYAGGGVDFKGVFDGNGKTVSGVYIKSGGYMGFFGSTGTNAEIKNLGIINSYIGATDIYAGGLVAMNSGKISNCYFNGKVVSTYQPQFSNVAYTGGLVGQNSGLYAVVSNSYATGLVSGRGGIGGLVGVNRSNARIEKSYSAVSVIAQTNDNVGGIVGNLESGAVTGSYYDNTVNSAIVDIRDEGKSTIALKKIATFEDWDFANIWGRNNSLNGGYPYLRWGATVENDADTPDVPQEPTGPTTITPTKSGNGNGIIFKKNVVSISNSDKLEIVMVILPNGDKITRDIKAVIYDNTGNIVFSGEGAWNLRNKSGRFVVNGSYLVIVEAKDRNGKSYWYSAKVGVNK